MLPVLAVGAHSIHLRQAVGVWALRRLSRHQRLHRDRCRCLCLLQGKKPQGVAGLKVPSLPKKEGRAEGPKALAGVGNRGRKEEAGWQVRSSWPEEESNPTP